MFQQTFAAMFWQTTMFPKSFALVLAKTFALIFGKTFAVMFGKTFAMMFAENCAVTFFKKFCLGLAKLFALLFSRTFALAFTEALAVISAEIFVMFCKGGVLPCDVSPTPKNIDFLPLLVSKIYHTLPLYCATVLFFLDTSVQKPASRVALLGQYS